MYAGREIPVPGGPELFPGIPRVSKHGSLATQTAQKAALRPRKEAIRCQRAPGGAFRARLEGRNMVKTCYCRQKSRLHSFRKRELPMSFWTSFGTTFGVTSAPYWDPVAPKSICGGFRDQYEKNIAKAPRGWWFRLASPGFAWVLRSLKGRISNE